MTIITRAQWEARSARRTTRIAGPVVGIAGHWEGIQLGDYSAGSVPGRIRNIQAFHMDRQGWDDIAYSALVDRFGRVWAGRGPTVRTAANGTNYANDHFYAVCILMGPGDTLTDAAKAGWLEAREWLRRNGDAGAKTPPHSILHSTSCPGDDVRKWLNDGVPSPGLWTPPDISIESAASNSSGSIRIPELINPDVYSIESEVAQMPVVQQGSDGQHVRILQGLLVANGRNVAVDGDFGAKTATALREWQAAVGLTADAIAGPKTWRRLLCV